jgi:Na+(H+)/acetate symporter ActP
MSFQLESLVFVFFQFYQPPIHFNSANLEKLENTEYADDLADLQAQHNTLFLTQQGEVRALMDAIDMENEPAIATIQERLTALRETDKELRTATKDLILQADPASKIKDTDYVFITFVTEYLPVGLVGLLLAVIFSAAMSSTASELNALATTTVVDLYRRSLVKDKSDRHYLNASKAFTVVWGGIALIFAATANLFENLIQAVNIIGSLFYGAILGIFVVAFFMKKVGARAVFIGALIGEAIVLVIFTLNSTGVINIAYLWLNLIGCVLVMGIAWILEQVIPKR